MIYNSNSNIQNIIRVFRKNTSKISVKVTKKVENLLYFKNDM